jgi:hypothetical protein
MSELWSEYHEIQDARMQKQRELMKEYDLTVYYPAMESLRERCGKAGHVRGKFHSNGLGWTWFWCHNCGAKIEAEGPNGESEP